MRWSILGSLAVSSCGTTHAQEPRRNRYVMERPAADTNQRMVMWVLDTQTGEVLHTDDVIQKGSLPIDKGIVLTSTTEIFNEIAKGKGPKISILAIGYAGWEAGQLESEIKQNSWMTLPVESSFIFDEQVSNKWDAAYKILGFDPAFLSHFSGNA